MNNLTEKYNGKNGYEGTLIHFVYTDYHINLKGKNILVKYNMVVENALGDFEIKRIPKSYSLFDIPERTVTRTRVIEEPEYNEEGLLITEGVFEEYTEVLVEEDLAFTKWQNFPLETAVRLGVEKLEDLFFINTKEHILEINGYTDEDLVSNNTEEVE